MIVYGGILAMADDRQFGRRPDTAAGAGASVGRAQTMGYRHDFCIHIPMPLDSPHF